MHHFCSCSPRTAVPALQNALWRAHYHTLPMSYLWSYRPVDMKTCEHHRFNHIQSYSINWFRQLIHIDSLMGAVSAVCVCVWRFHVFRPCLLVNTSDCSATIIDCTYGQGVWDQVERRLLHFEILDFPCFIAFRLKSLISLCFIMSKPQTRYWPIWRFDIGAESRLNLKEHQRIPRKSRIEPKSSNQTSALFCFFLQEKCGAWYILIPSKGICWHGFSMRDSSGTANENASACHLPSRALSLPWLWEAVPWQCLGSASVRFECSMWGTSSCPWRTAILLQVKAGDHSERFWIRIVLSGPARCLWVLLLNLLITIMLKIPNCMQRRQTYCLFVHFLMSLHFSLFMCPPLAVDLSVPFFLVPFSLFLLLSNVILMLVLLLLLLMPVLLLRR